ncbi:hypothetical protein OPV22_021570 [Ensete ventricosum]|uniref:Non-reducing end beta-L-arabinofuranosidase-like GH127 middle domain-containing protein n=1 Tax=Ensete ventricosum TaxID=4639 RepID=A0AAV8QLI2_ENSVE|nr:hypothetical protein OPV22_021570 [Ensete ventricosum]
MGFEGGGDLWVLRRHTDDGFPLGAENTIGGGEEHEPICESVIEIGPRLANKHLGSGRFDPEPSYDSAVSKNSTVNIQIPVWTYNHDVAATINGHTVAVPPPGNVLSVDKSWSRKDQLTLSLPIGLRTEAIQVSY